MGNPLRIYSGPGEITIFDATNGTLHLGYNKEISVEGTPQQHELMDGNIHQFSTLTKFTAPMLQSDNALISQLKSRRSTKQQVTIVGFESVVRLKNVFVGFGLKRPYKAAEAHSIDLTAQTAVEDDVVLIENLLGTTGNFDTAGGDADLGAGWSTNVLQANRSRPSSFLSGMGSCQQITLAAGEYLRATAIFAFEQQKRLTLSGNFKHISGPTTLLLSISLLDSDNQVIAIHSSTVTISSTPSRESYSVLVTPSEPVYRMRFEILPNPSDPGIEMQVDNVQAEFGELTDYVESTL